MKAIVLTITFLLSFVISFAQTTPHQVSLKKDTTYRKQPVKHQLVKGRSARRRLQQQQIKKHKKELKKFDSLDNQINKTKPRSNSTQN